MSDINNPILHERLSSAGELRRDAILDLLQGEMRTVHRRRRMHRQIAASSLMLVLVAGLTVLIQSSWRSREHTQDGQRFTAESAPDNPGCIIEMVQTDESIIDRWRTNSVPQADWLDDRTLLAALHDLGRPTGLIRAEGRTWLTSNVVDPIAAATGGM